MDEPLIVPGHPIDNQATDDFWPHLSPTLDPVFFSDDGASVGPIKTIGAKWSFSSPEPIRFGTLPAMMDAEIALTDSRIVVLGRPGANCPPDRRLVTQFRFVWCSAIEWNFSSPSAPATIELHGMTLDDQLIERKLAIRLPPSFDARAFAQDILRRVARHYLGMDLVDPGQSIGDDETDRDYVEELAQATIDPSELQGMVPFPSFRWIRNGDDFRVGGPEVRGQIPHAELRRN